MVRLQSENLIQNPSSNKITKLICLKCGNTEEFYVDSERICVGADLTFNDDGSATLDDSFAQDFDVYPGTCAKCGAEVGDTVLIEKKEIVCGKCERRFECFTERNSIPCQGFLFKEEFAELD